MLCTWHEPRAAFSKSVCKILAPSEAYKNMYLNYPIATIGDLFPSFVILVQIAWENW